MMNQQDSYNLSGVPSERTESAYAADALRPARKKHFEELTAAFDASVGGVQFLASGNVPVFRRFAGYARLQQLSQDAMIRLMVLTRTGEMLRKWIEFKGLDPEKAKKFEEFVNASRLRSTLQKAVSLMGFFGGSYIFIDTGAPTEKLKDPLSFAAESAEFKTLRFRVIDPVFTTPAAFNATKPLDADFYKPQTFLVMGVPVHRSRLVRFVENEIDSDVLKPSYNFLGLPQAQLLEDYVNDFRANREAVNRMLKKYSSSFLKANLKSLLYGGVRGALSQVENRIKTFVRWRNNDGVSIIDKETEDFSQVNTPITGLDALLSQSLQFCVAVNRTNVVKTLGLSPAGFNTGDSDIKTHNDLIGGLQEQVLREPLSILFRAINLHLYGDAAPVDFTFKPLNEQDERSVAETEKIKIDGYTAMIDTGVISPEEARRAISQAGPSALASILSETTAPGADDPFSDLTGAGGKEADNGRT